jgi:hypothetical protein
MRYCPPRLIEPLVARPRIARRMAEAAGKVTLVVGPPGSGKTSALASHHADLAAGGAAVRWLTLSAEDNDPAILRRHLDHAFRGAGAEGREESEGLSDPPEDIVGFIDGLEKIDAAPARALIGASSSNCRRAAASTSPRAGCRARCSTTVGCAASSRSSAPTSCA